MIASIDVIGLTHCIIYFPAYKAEADLEEQSRPISENYSVPGLYPAMDYPQGYYLKKYGLLRVPHSRCSGSAIQVSHCSIDILTIFPA